MVHLVRITRLGDDGGCCCRGGCSHSRYLLKRVSGNFGAGKCGSCGMHIVVVIICIIAAGFVIVAVSIYDARFQLQEVKNKSTQTSNWCPINCQIHSNIFSLKCLYFTISIIL